ncbi:MAG: hypothetical protein JNL83_07145, partial [Myxococcales bacterium]|nr:hypothetical protein [Myxococcales bacterium]
MAAPTSASEQAGVDWRRLASDRNVKPDVAKGLWDRASSQTEGDEQKAEQVFKRLLEEAANSQV